MNNNTKKYRVIAYVDGYNLFHGIRDFRDRSTQPKSGLQTLDLFKFCASLLTKEQTLGAVYYFSAYADWRPDDKKKHKLYIEQLQRTGVQVRLGHFHKKRHQCGQCGHKITTHEEKETDVHIALQMLEDCIDDHVETLLLISADADLVPVIRSIKKRFSGKRIIAAIPKPRINRARGVMGSVFKTYTITEKRLRENQF